MNIVIDNFKIPKGSEKYITYQRTPYQVPIIEKIFRKLGIRTLYNKYILPHTESLRISTIRKKYYLDLKNEYLNMQSVLPSDVKNILDIGCGIAGIDLFLFHHYVNEKPDLFLIDKNGIQDVYYGFKKDAAFYNSLELTSSFLEMNRVPREKIHTIDVIHEPFPKKTTFGLVLSLLSWGFHYPVSTYMENVCNVLSPDGLLIIDIRKNTDGEAVLKRNFKHVLTISDKKKYRRLCCSFNPVKYEK